MTGLVIGLTGGIGSGKTMASDHFARLGITIVDADLAARVIVEPGQPALQEIAAHFGNDVLLADGTLNRAALRHIVFTQPEARTALERITHPRIAAEIARQLAASTSPYTLLVSPLLFESGQSRFAARTVLIDTTEALQHQRAAQRDNVSEAHIKAIMAAQMSREERLKRADDVLLNDGDLAHLHQAVEALHHRYLALAATPSH
jgi:dephospho-CoA kinase